MTRRPTRRKENRHELTTHDEQDPPTGNDEPPEYDLDENGVSKTWPPEVRAIIAAIVRDAPVPTNAEAMRLARLLRYDEPLPEPRKDT